MRHSIPCLVVNAAVHPRSSGCFSQFLPDYSCRQCFRSYSRTHRWYSQLIPRALSSKNILLNYDKLEPARNARPFQTPSRSFGRYNTGCGQRNQRAAYKHYGYGHQGANAPSMRNPHGYSKCTRSMATTSGTTRSRAFIALGSNMGDRIAMVEQACSQMEARGIRILRTSSLFETAPMYVKDQGSFVNGVCEVETSMRPMELLDALQSVENSMGRKRLIDKGPRVIDLDVLLYNQDTISNERLDVPHKLMLEREFVLRPLCQLIPDSVSPGSSYSRSYQSYLDTLPPCDPAPIAITPLRSDLPPLTPSDPKRYTHIMAVLNVTPDSFSDGGIHSATDSSSLVLTVREFLRNGATIIDIGGESTRPHADPITEQEELSRVIPVIQLIRALPEFNQLAISIDTYRASVAEAAVHAGADIINDISSGLMDPVMLATMARLGKTVILSHTRGTPKTMTKLTKYPSGVVQGVCTELSHRIDAAEHAGIRRWRIIADPGIGFAKNQDQNLTLLRNMRDLRKFGKFSYLPWLVGTSRKGFVGRVTQVEEASERGWGTGAAITAAIGGGADIVRVHDVKEMHQVTRMADAIYRQGFDA